MVLCKPAFLAASLLPFTEVVCVAKYLFAGALRHTHCASPVKLLIAGSKQSFIRVREIPFASGIVNHYNGRKRLHTRGIDRSSKDSVGRHRHSTGIDHAGLLKKTQIADRIFAAAPLVEGPAMAALDSDVSDVEGQLARR